ncbi:MAG: 2-hydroxyacid dehydrogenase [Burkholderiaceae bacterium]|nr:2-hydroxyacid dehydrogenase [Burkholderiaceae bacterium]
MNMPRILQIGSLSGSPNADQEIARRYQVLEYWKASDPIRFLRDEAQDIEVVATSAMTGCTAAIIDALPRLRAIVSWGVGFDSIDVDRARARGVVVSNTPDVLNDCVADLAWALLLGCARQIAWGDRNIRAHRWTERAAGLPLAPRVHHKKLGVVGLGRIGEAIAQRGRGFDMEVGYHNRNPRRDVSHRYFDSLVELATWSDFLVVATVGGSSTRHLVNEPVLRALGPAGIVVNIARGTVIDEAALVSLLSQGLVGGAALDVFEHEPQVPEALKHMDNVVLMPHVGSATIETRRAMLDLVLDNLQSFFSTGKLLTPI